jgi:hypothetical protein
VSKKREGGGGEAEGEVQNKRGRATGVEL